MSDAVQRALFCKSINQDFSLIAPAGVGKSYSIVERIFTLAQEKPEELPALCVITYTRKAAETLKVRTFERLKQSPNFKAILPLLEQSFFGTIHSLCWQHIQQFYPQKPFEILQDREIFKQVKEKIQNSENQWTGILLIIQKHTIELQIAQILMQIEFKIRELKLSLN